MFLLHQLPARLTYIILVVCAALFGHSASVGAAEWKSLQLGYQGIAKVGRWIPIHAEATGLPAETEVKLLAEFSDPRGDTCVQSIAGGMSSGDGAISLKGVASCGRLAGSGSISLVSSTGEILCRKSILHGEDVVLEETLPDVQNTLKLYKLDVPLLMTVGKMAGIDELLRNADQVSENRPILEGVSIPSLAEFPDNKAALDAVDFLILADSFATSDAQTLAIQQWVRSGGRLYVTTGSNVGELLASNLGQWLNGYFEIQPETGTTRNLTTLQSFVPGASRLETNRTDVPVAVLSSDQSTREVDSLNGPIVCTQSIAGGVVTIIAVDLNKRPLNNWNSLPQLYEVLLFGEKLSRKDSVSSRSSRISQTGVSDLATQMMSVIDAEHELGSWSTWSIMAMMVGWLILIGPVDYYLVTNILKRPHLTWVTFPLMIAGGVFATVWALGTNSTIQLNQLSFVDISTEEGKSQVDVRSWLSVSSPETLKAELTARPTAFASATDALDCNLMWSGRPEDVYGGMYRTGGIGLSRQNYARNFESPDMLSGVPLLTDGSRQLSAEWHSAPAQPLLSVDLSVSGFSLLDGTFSHNLPVPISDFMIMHGNRVYRMAEEDGGLTLDPGEVWSSRSSSVSASDLKGFLNGSRLVKASTSGSNRGSSQEITPYNAKSRDLQYMLTMATFYNVAGGNKYVGLSQDLLSHMEFSDTIRLNHAVGIGVIELPVTSLMMNGTDIEPTTSKTFVRLILPVKTRPSDSLAPTRAATEEAEKTQLIP